MQLASQTCAPQKLHLPLALLLLAACSGSSDHAGPQSRLAGASPSPSTPKATTSSAAAPGSAGASAMPGDSLTVGKNNMQSGLGVSGPDMLHAGQCARQDVSTSRITPTIWLVVDGSGSMVEALSQSDSTERWIALREALMDPQIGVVKSLEHHVRWGLVMYDGPLPGGFAERLPDGGVAKFSSGPATTCPRVVTVEPALDNFNAIDMAYTKDPLGGSTPTDKALATVVSHLSDESQTAPDTQAGPVIVVLATDGRAQ